MTSSDWTMLVVALVLVVFAGFVAAAEAGLSSFSKSRADRLVEEKVSGARRVSTKVFVTGETSSA